ncbi:MAG: indolepyruvate oxidoreductase subunit beta [Syntrophaceae bacterium]|nr:indolepyruvate oxidoreductase subunit beta [Syntrophaceae bacterium]
MDTKSIMIVGVGGLGVLRASDILCRAMMLSGLDVKKSEVHGMAQRGGCVTSHVRYGRKVYSPLAKKRDCDILVSFEKMETLRYLDYLREDGAVIINAEEIYPPVVNLGAATYPREIIETIRTCFQDVLEIDGPVLARAAGSIKAINTVLLGLLSTRLEVAEETWDRALVESFPSKLLEINRKAFQLGKKA